MYEISWHTENKVAPVRITKACAGGEV